MTPAITIEQSTFERLAKYAVTFDTPDVVLNRLMDAADALNSKTNSTPADRILSAESPPNLSYTTVKSITMNGKKFGPAETYWNPLLIAAIREAKKKMSKDKVRDLIICNHAVGQKEDNGYKYLADVGISIQGQDANNAWKAAYHILKEIKVPVEVIFAWQDNPKATSPGAMGKFVVAFD